MENLEKASTGGVSEGGGRLEYLLPSTGGVCRGGILAHPAAATSSSLLLDVQLYQSFVVCSQVTGVFVRSIIIPG